MAYDIYVYARPDSNIAYTEVTRTDTGETIRVYKDEKSEKEYHMTVIYGVSGAVSFDAFPDEGYEFFEYVYRVGSDTATQQTEKAQQFLYLGDQDIHIRAVAIPEASTTSIDEFDWDISNGSASATLTQKAYETLVNKGKVKDFSHLVWNDMVDKLNEVIEAEGYSWESDVATLARTKMTSTDRAMTAVRFNSFAGNMVGYGLSSWTSVKKGDPTIAQTFLDLVDTMNGYIRENHQ